MFHRVRVAAIIIEDNKVLLVKHVHPVTGFEFWVPPGGGLESIDRDIFDCAARETWEETGYKIKANDILFIREFVDVENNNYNLEIFLKGKIENGELTIKNIYGNGPDEHFIKDARWLGREEVKGLEVFPEVLKQDDFWESHEQEIFTKYLGRQEG